MCECLYPIPRPSAVNYLTDPSVCELEMEGIHTRRADWVLYCVCVRMKGSACTVSSCCMKYPSESMVLTSGHYSFYLNLPQAVSYKVGSRDWSAFTASGSVLA